MALCSECGETISLKVNTCPICGKKFRSQVAMSNNQLELIDPPKLDAKEILTLVEAEDKKESPVSFWLLIPLVLILLPILPFPIWLTIVLFLLGFRICLYVSL